MKELVGYELKRAQQALRSALNQALAELGLTAPQYAVLAVLEEAPGVSSAELARRCFVTAQTMNAIVAGLQRRALLERGAHPTHGRVLETRLTPAGSSLLAGAHGRVRAVERVMTTEVSPSERLALVDLLRRCATALERERGTDQREHRS